MFLPLYGKETGMARSDLVEQILHLEKELYRAEQIPGRVLVATLIISNKLIDKARLQQIWEEIKMLDIFEIATEEGMKEGRVEGTRDMVIDALLVRFPLVPPTISEKIRTIQNLDLLKGLHRQAVKCKDLQEFTSLVQQAI